MQKSLWFSGVTGLEQNLVRSPEDAQYCLRNFHSYYKVKIFGIV